MKQNIFNPIQKTFKHSFQITREDGVRLVCASDNTGFIVEDTKRDDELSLCFLRRSINGKKYTAVVWRDGKYKKGTGTFNGKNYNSFDAALQAAANDIIAEHNANTTKEIFDGLNARIDANIEAMQHKLSLRVAHFRAVLNAQVIQLHK